MFALKDRLSGLVQDKVTRRLRKVSNEEVVRWSDGIAMAIGKNLGEMRKSLDKGDSVQALVYIADTIEAAQSLAAAMAVISERCSIE